MLDRNYVKFLLVRNPFAPELREEWLEDYDGEKTLKDYVGNISTKSGVNLIAAIDGCTVENNWNEVKPSPGSCVSITAELEGSAIAAWVFGVSSIAALSGAAYMAAVALAFVINVAIGIGINMLISAITGGYETPDQDREDSPTYSWRAFQPTEAEGHPIPIIYGTHRVAGQVINKFVTFSGKEDDDVTTDMFGDSEDQEQAKQYLNVLLSVGEGPVDEISDIKIDEQPFTNFKDVVTYTRLGNADDAVIENFNKIVYQQNLGYILSQGETAAAQTIGNNIERLVIVITAPHGIYKAKDDGSIGSLEASVDIFYREVGASSWNSLGSITFENDTTQKLQGVKTVSNLTPSQYEVQVVKTTQDFDDDFKKETTVRWTVLKEEIDQSLSYPGVAKYGVKALATDQLSGRQPSFTCLVKRNTVPIFNPNTGETLNRSAQNPAWAAYHYLTVHHGIDASRLIYSEFEDWADYCDYLVVGDQEKFGIVLDKQSTLWKDVQKIARLGRASIVKRGTKIGVFVDKEEDTNTAPTHMFTMSNIIKDSFSYQFMPMKDRANVLELTYTDYDRDFTNQVVSVHLEDFVDSERLPKKANIQFEFSICRDRAIQEAIYLLKSTRYLIRTVEFEADVDSFNCTVGDLVYFQHEIPSYKDSYGGRLEHASDNYVELDTEVYVEAGVAYKVLVRHSDSGEISERDVESIGESGLQKEFNVLSSFDPVPSSGDLYLFGKSNTVDKLYRITNITRAQDNTRKISCIEYVPEVYQADGGFVSPEPESFEQEAINVTAKEFLTFSGDGSLESNISVSWYPSVDNVSSTWVVWLVDITSQSNDSVGGAVKVTETTNLSCHIGPEYLALQHEYKIYVNTVSSGPTETSDGENTAVVQILGKMAPPNIVSGFSATWDQSKREVLFSWNEVTNIDLSHYEIRRVSEDVLAENQTWENAEVRLESVNGYSAVESISEDGEQGVFTYFIKSVDSSGNYSDEADQDSVEINLDSLDHNLPQPDGLEVTSNCTSAVATMTATWNTEAENHPFFSHYRVEKREYINDPIFNTSYFETEESNYTWEGVSKNELYGIRVRTISTASTATLRGPWSHEVQHTTCADSEPPATPGITKLVPGYKVMGVHWEEIDDQIDRYEIQRSTPGSDSWEIVGSTSGDFATDTELDVDQEYCYRVRSVDSSGNASEWSESSCATTLKVGWSDITFDILTANEIYVDYLSALSANIGTLTAGYIISETFLDNGWEINDNHELVYTGEDVDWDDVKKEWDGMYIDTNHPMIYLGTSENEHYVLLEPGRCEFYGTVNFWNSPNDWTMIDGGQIHASSSITIGEKEGGNLLDYCFIDSGDIEFYRWFGNLGEHRKVKSLKKIDIGSATSGEDTQLNGYWASEPRIVVFPKEVPTYISSFTSSSQEIKCEVASKTYNSSTGVCSFTPNMYTTFADEGGGGSGWIYVDYGIPPGSAESWLEYIEYNEDYYHYIQPWLLTPAVTVPGNVNQIEIRATLYMPKEENTWEANYGTIHETITTVLAGKVFIRIGSGDNAIDYTIFGPADPREEKTYNINEVVDVPFDTSVPLRMGITREPDLSGDEWWESTYIYECPEQELTQDQIDSCAETVDRGLDFIFNSYSDTNITYGLLNSRLSGIQFNWSSYRPTDSDSTEGTTDTSIAGGEVAYMAIEGAEEES